MKAIFHIYVVRQSMVNKDNQQPSGNKRVIKIQEKKSVQCTRVNIEKGKNTMKIKINE